MKWALSIPLAALALALATAASGASSPTIVPTGAPVFPDRSYLLTLPAAKALNASQIKVTENGFPVSGLELAREGASARSRSAVVLEIDESLTMKGKPIQDAFAAARAFATAANTDEEIAIVTFNGAVKVLQPFTYSASVISAALKAAPTLSYGTKTYDALSQGAALIAAAHVPTGSIIVLTDGQRVGGARPSAVLPSLAAAHVRVFAVGLVSPAFNPGALKQMAAATDGAYVPATSLARLTPILDSIGQRLGSEYLVRYRSLQNPKTHVLVAVAVQGEPGAATTRYLSPPLTIAGAPPYHPSELSRIILSPVVMVVVILAIVSLLLFAMTTAFGERNAPLLARVGSFVSLAPKPGSTQTAVERQPATVATRGGLLASVERLGAQQGLIGRMRTTLELADIRVPVLQVLLLAASATVIVGFLFDLLLGALGLVASLIIVPYATRWFILRKVRRKRRAFADQLPDNLDVLASALRAGHSLVSAMAVVADDASEPSRTEYRRVLAEEQFGVQLEDALKVAAVRMDNRDLEQVALVARLQREMGSNSAEVLDRVIETVRGRMELVRLVRTLTAQGRLSRWILTGLPLALAVILTLLDAHYMHPLLHTLIGRVLVIIAACMVAFGSFVIGKIIDIKA